MFPWPIYSVKALGVVQGVLFTHLSRKPLKAITTSDVADCSIGPPAWLLAWRLLAFLYTLAIGVAQLSRTGPYIFVFFTVWNWWFLTAYFGLAAILSLRAVLARRRGGAQPALARALVVMFHIESPLVWVIDLTTWLILVPMLLATPDPAKREYWVRIMFCFTSYNVRRDMMYHEQHGFNAVLMLVELVLSRIPVNFYMSGYMALWLSAFAAWSTLFYWRTGRFIYPFLDAHKPYAWVGYVGLYAAFWAAYLAFMGMHRAKARLLAGRALERKVQ